VRLIFVSNHPLRLPMVTKALPLKSCQVIDIVISIELYVRNLDGAIRGS
jgi:hypothetical protein